MSNESQKETNVAKEAYVVARDAKILSLIAIFVSVFIFFLNFYTS